MTHLSPTPLHSNFKIAKMPSSVQYMSFACLESFTNTINICAQSRNVLPLNYKICYSLLGYFFMNSEPYMTAQETFKSSLDLMAGDLK